MYRRWLTTAALNSNGRYKYKAPEMVVDHLIIGAGVVGLAIGQRLSQRFPRKTTYVVERHAQAGMETSSRNSEVVHAGLYYPLKSLKTRLCLRGRPLLYDRCDRFNIPYRKTGKLVVAHAHQRSYLEILHAKAMALEWSPHSHPQHAGDGSVLPTELLTGDEARELEPDLSPSIAAALLSPETGIVNTHALMQSLEGDIQDSEGGELVYSTRVVRVDPYKPPNYTSGSRGLPNIEGGWLVQTVTGSADESDAILAKTLINSTGLSGHLILNSLLPERSRIPMYYARGSYAAYSGPGTSRVSRLIYPCPQTGKTSHGFQSLGTHLTLDMQNNVRFGPDLEWIPPPGGHSQQEETDYWEKYLVPDDSRLAEMYKSITDYLPGVTFEGLRPDYVGIRPKLVGLGGGFQDFVIRVDSPDSLAGRASTRHPMISLLGIESPGLTASLAIAEYIVEDVLVDAHDK